MPRLVLGSTSPYRSALLERLRTPFTAAAPGVDEDRAKASGAAPREVVEQLAREKALAVQQHHHDAVVIGSDQGAVLDAELLDKPGTEQNAGAQLRALRGRAHELVTAVAIAHPAGLVTFTDVTTLWMRELSDDEIDRYVQSDQPLQCAGSYRIESLGITLFDRIESGDHTAIVGLPLARLARELRALGFLLP